MPTPESPHPAFTNAIARGKISYDNVDIKTSVNTTPEINLTGAAAGAVYVPVGNTATSLTVYAKVHNTATYAPLLNSAGSPVTIPITPGSMTVFPDSLYVPQFVKFVANGTAEDSVIHLST